jgi:hypothetical protein
MTDETSTGVWVADIEGRKALTGDFDSWRVRGWVEATEPEPGEFVWLQHEETQGKQLFPQQVVGTWEALGWKPCEPPKPVDLTKDPKLTDAVPVTEPVTAPKPAKATSGIKKEQQ